MNNVYFSQDLDTKFLNNLKDQLKSNFKDCKKIAIKIHFGDDVKNRTALFPEQIEPITNLLKELNISFFLFDSSVAYPDSLRDNPITHKQLAIERGWNTIGEIRTDDSKFITVKGDLDYQLCKELVDADGVLVISHFKGHYHCTGIAGAIKNIGMGAFTKKTKGEIHDGGKPIYTSGCVQCKLCEKSCPFEGIEVKDKPIFKKCFGCSNCIYVCPNKCIKTKVNYFDYLLSEAAFLAQSNFKKFYYINIARNITKACDCDSNSGPIIAKDVGYFSSNDAVAIDKACYDSIVKTEGYDPFLKNGKKPGIKHIEFAEKLGLGKKEYKFVDI
ncbi:MAG: DUF362 domain-containing protein [archaeon]